MGEFLFPRDLYVNKPSSLNTGSVWVSTDTNRFFVGPMELPVLQNANTFERTITLQTPTSSVNTLGLNITETRTGSTYIPFTQLVNPYGSISTYLYQSNTRGFDNNAYKGVTIYNVVSGAVIKSTSNLEFNSFISSTGSVIKLNSNLVDLYGNKPELADSFLVNISGSIKASGTVSGSIFNATTYQVLGTNISSLYQATLVSGTNIKTINGESLLGSGNIVTTGSSGSVGITDGDKGDITVSGSGSIWTIDNNVITDSKISGSISQSKITSLVSDLSSKAPIASPTFTGTLTAPTLNGTSAIQLNGTSINTAGTLSNVAYKGQDNSFTTTQTMTALNVTTGATTSSKFHLGTGTSVGCWITSITDNQFALSGGCEYVSGSWTARDSYAQAINLFNGSIIFRSNTGLTAGNTFTPTQRMIIQGDGKVGIGLNPTELLDIAGSIKTSGNVIVSGTVTGVRTDTIDTADSSAVVISSFNSLTPSATRGASILVAGNEYATNPGSIRYYAGESGSHYFYVNGSVVEAISSTGVAITGKLSTSNSITQTLLGTVGHGVITSFSGSYENSYLSHIAKDASNNQIWRASWKRNSSSTAYFLQFLNSADTYYWNSIWFDYTNKRVGINNASPTEVLDVNGNIKASGTVTAPTLNATTALQLNGTSIFSRANTWSAINTFSADLVLGSVIIRGTTDGADNARTQIGGGGAIGVTRGAYASIMGNEYTGQEGNFGIVAGNSGVSGAGKIVFYTGNAEIRGNISNTGKWMIGSANDATEALDVTGNIKANGTVTGNLIQSNGHVVLLNSGVDQSVRGSTSDGSDNGGLKLTPASSPSVSRGAVITMYGNEHTTYPGQLLLASGAASGSNVKIAHNGITRILIDDDNDIDVTGNIKASGDIQLSKTLLVPMLSTNTEGYGIKIGNTTLFNSHFAQGANASYNLDMMHNTLISNTAGTETYKWVSTHASFGSRGISFRYGAASGKGIIFYADAVATTAGSTFTPTQRMIIQNDGKVGIGLNPTELFEVGGNIKASGTVTTATLNGTTAIQLNGTSINTTGTLSNVAYKGQNNNFTVAQTINNQAAAATKIGLVNGAFGAGSPGLYFHNISSAYITPAITGYGSTTGLFMLAYTEDSEWYHSAFHFSARKIGGTTLTTGRPFIFTNYTTELFSINYDGKVKIGTGTATEALDVTGNIKASGNINATSAIQLNGTDINTTGTLSNVAYKGQNNNFTVGQTISENISTVSRLTIRNTNTGTGAFADVTVFASDGSGGYNGGSLGYYSSVFSSSLYANYLRLSAGPTSLGVLIDASNTTDGRIRFKTGNTEKWRIANNGNLSNDGADGDEPIDVTGNIKASGTVNAVTAIQLNGTDINTAGTLSNVVYKNQNNNFTTGQTITEALDVDIFNYLSDELIPNNTFSEGIASWSVAPYSTNWLDYVGGKLIFNASWVNRRSHYLQSSGSVFSYNTGDYIVYELQLSSSSNLSYVDIPYSLPSQSLIRSGITYFTNQVTSSVTLQGIAYCTGSGSGYYRVNISPNTSTTCSVVIDNVSVRKISPPDVTTFATFTNLNEQKLSIYNVPRSQDPLGNDLGTLSLKIGTNNNESPISRFGEDSNIFIGNNNFSSSVSCPLNTRDILVVGNNNLSNVSNSSPQGFLLHQSSVILGNNILANASVPYTYDHNILIGMDVLKDSKVTFSGGSMVFIGYRSGRESDSQNSVNIGTYSGEYSKGYGNVLLGQNAGQYASSSGSGAQTAVGGYALAGVSFNRLIGNFNTAIGNFSSRFLSDTSSENFSGGFYSLSGNSALGTAPCSNNVAVGSYALQSVNFVNSTVAVGHSSLGSLVQGRYIVAIGQSAGEIAAEAATHNYCSQSVFIGAYTKPQANSGSNEIVIGFNVTGKGSNTATIGQGLTATYLSGTVSGSIFNATTYQVLGTNISSLYQATLVSGTNIKTINGNSLLGSGNINITGSSGSISATNPVFYGVVSVTGSISATGSISCNTLYANEVIIGSGTGSLPKSGTLASPPVGLAIGESWLDTTDSTTHPILRMRVL